MAGKSFEHYILMELLAYIGITGKRFNITYWRTKTGLEVDFIIGDALIAIEVKISEQVHQQDLKGLMAFCEEHPQAKGLVVSQDKKPRLLEVNSALSISILPWETFLTKLWAGEIF
jgi:predicted AAA+ superfamily ATPase